MKCKHCKSSDVIKNGSMKRWSGGKKYKVQRFLCNNCGRTTLGRRTWL